MGLILSSGQALVWDGAARRYRLLKKGDHYRGARILDLGVDRLLLERKGRKFIWKLGAPVLLHPTRGLGRRARRPGLIITPQAPPPPGPAIRPAPRRATLPPVPHAADEPRKTVVKRASLSWAVVQALAGDFRAARREIRVKRLGRGLKVTHLRAKGPLRRAGLARGDVILRIQGRVVSSPAEAAVSYAGLGRGRVLRIELRRQNRIIDLRLRLR